MLDWGPWGGQRSWTLGRGQSQIGRAGRRPNWWRRPLRAIHTVLREPDAAEYDLEGVLAWLRRWRANVYAVNGGDRELFEAPPDWFGCDAEGAPKMTTGLYAACPNSPFRNEGFAYAVVHEVLARCRPDGIWENAASF